MGLGLHHPNTIIIGRAGHQEEDKLKDNPSGPMSMTINKVLLDIYTASCDDLLHCLLYFVLSLLVFITNFETNSLP